LGVFTLVVPFSWSFLPRPKNKMIHLILVLLAFTLSFLTLNLKIQIKLTSIAHKQSSAAFLGSHLVFALIICLWSVLHLHFCQTTPEFIWKPMRVWMAVFTLSQMNHTNQTTPSTRVLTCPLTEQP